MAWMHPLAVEHRRKMFTRQDAWRLAPPGTPEARMPGYLHPSARIAAYERAQQETAAREAAAWEADQRELLQIRREFDELKREVAVKRAAWEREDEAARIKCDIAWERFADLQAICRAAESRVDRKWDAQPRDDHGRFDFGKKPTAKQQDEVQVAARVSPALEAFCERQYDSDVFHCKMVGSPACCA
jgi:hypothetical protein